MGDEVECAGDLFEEGVSVGLLELQFAFGVEVGDGKSLLRLSRHGSPCSRFG